MRSFERLGEEERRLIVDAWMQQVSQALQCSMYVRSEEIVNRHDRERFRCVFFFYIDPQRSKWRCDMMKIALAPPP
jgi:hypothetical protein